MRRRVDTSLFHDALMRKVYPKDSPASTVGRPVIIRTEQGNRDAGHIRAVGQHKVFVKLVSATVHLQRNMDAWGIDSRVLDLLKELNIPRIRIIDRESNSIYDAHSNTILNHGVRRDFGYGEQIFLSRKYWFKGEPDKFGGSGERYGE